MISKDGVFEEVKLSDFKINKYNNGDIDTSGYFNLDMSTKKKKAGTTVQPFNTLAEKYKASQGEDSSQ